MPGGKSITIPMTTSTSCHESFPSEWNLSLFDRMMMFTGVRADHPEWERLSVKVGRGVLARFDRTIASFYERCKEGKKPGFPRFKPSRRWRSIEMADPTPSMLVAPETPRNQSSRWWRLSVKGVPRVRFRDKGNRLEKAFGMGATVKELRVVRTPLRVELHVVLKHPDRELPERPIANPVGIDKGIRHRMTLSDGTRIPARAVDLKTIIKKQRILSRAIKSHQDREQTAGKKLPHSNTRKKKQEAFARAWRRETDRAHIRARAQDRHAHTPGGQGPPVSCSVDAQCQPTHHHRPMVAQSLPALLCHPQPRLRGPSRPHHRYSGPSREGASRE